MRAQDPLHNAVSSDAAADVQAATVGGGHASSTGSAVACSNHHGHTNGEIMTDGACNERGGFGDAVDSAIEGIGADDDRRLSRELISAARVPAALKAPFSHPHPHGRRLWIRPPRSCEALPSQSRVGHTRWRLARARRAQGQALAELDTDVDAADWAMV